MSLLIFARRVERDPAGSPCPVPGGPAGREPKRWHRGWIVAAMLLAGCSSALRRADRHALNTEWLKAVVEYRVALKADPDNAELKSKLIIAEQRAGDFYYARGQVLKSQAKLDEAAAEFQKGMVAAPGNDKLVAALAGCLAERAAERDIQEAARLERAGNMAEARDLLLSALESFPESAAARSALARIARTGASRSSPLFTERPRATLRFAATESRTAFDTLAKSFGIVVIFDEAVRSIPVTLVARDVTVEQALDALAASAQCFFRKMGPDTILVAPDTPAKRDQYEDLIIRTFPLNTMKASEMALLLKSILGLNQITVNDGLKTLVVRDTADILGLVDQLIQVHDRKPAEVLLEVEILEINRAKAEQLGLNYGTQVMLDFPETTVDALLHGRGAAESVFQQGVVTFPRMVFTLFKQDVDAKILANPKIRVLDGKAARIHVGDRVPLRTSTIQDATGQLRITYDYKDIGIKVETTPTVNLDNSVLVKVNLEISTLGANLGSQSEPSYAIGARNVDTVMMLRDGETALVGGLLRNEERRTVVKIPGLGNIPIVGPLFTTAKYEDTTTTDVLLTLTPHVVRGWSVPAREQREIYSGSAGRLTGRRSLNGLPPATVAATPAAVPLSGTLIAASSTAYGAGLGATGEAKLGFAEGLYEVSTGDVVELTVTGSNLPRLDGLVFSMSFNPQLVRFEGATTASAKVVRVDNTPASESGNIELRIAFQGGVQLGVSEPLAKVRLRGLTAGVSYLIIFVNSSLHGADGQAFRAQAGSSRLLVK